MTLEKKYYFASDFHLGTPNHEQSLIREKKVVAWLDSIKNDCKELFLVGDIFDFWFEYKYVSPKGFTRLLGKIAEFTDAGIPVHFFVGNHDMWMFGYLKDELGIQIHYHPIERTIANKEFFIGHGDGLGPGDKGYKFLKKIFRNKFARWFFARFHPNFSFHIANTWSRKSRSAQSEELGYLGDDKEFLVQFCKSYSETNSIDYFIFGHRHLPLDIEINNTAKYINLGDWLTHFSFGVFDGIKFELKTFKN